MNGLHFDLSNLFGTNKVLFTTPPAGCFTFMFQYLGRKLDICLSGRNLYVMGWRSQNGTFELKLKSEKRKNFMRGEGVIVIPCKKNYRFLAPQGDVSNVRLGFFAIREAFEVLYKSTGETDEAMAAVGTFAVHTSEAGRLQDVLKDVCTASLQNIMGTVGSKNKFWIQRYDHYAELGMEQINALLHGKTAAGIEACEKAVAEGVEISQEIVLHQIRIFPRDAYNIGVFQHEQAPKDQSEDDSVDGSDSSLKSSKDMKRETKEKKRDKRKMKDDSVVEEVPTGDGGSPAAVPLYLLKDWFAPQD
jgi:cob(I)alamin adenosyltransferase